MQGEATVRKKASAMNDKTANLGYARLDLAREERTGMPETVFCAGKTPQQLVEILRAFATRGVAVLGTRCSEEQHAEVARQADLRVQYDGLSRVLLSEGKMPEPLHGQIAVCTGGTADIPVAEEAARTAEFMGAQVARYYDVGVAGLHRLLDGGSAWKCDRGVGESAGDCGPDLGGIWSGVRGSCSVAFDAQLLCGGSLRGQY